MTPRVESKQQAPTGRKVVSWVALAGILVATWFVWTQRYWVYDTIRLRGYTPSAAIVQLADDTTMAPGTRRMFYAAHPQLEAKGDFTQCQMGEKTIILGCYTAQRTIYLYNVPDERLAGVEQVTAAHEVLHAAYERLSGAEKGRVNALLDQAFAKVTNERIQSNIAAYRQAGANVPNELHSILGTEVRDLPSELEVYYAQYFTNRTVIVSYMEQYEHEFTGRQEQVTTYDQQLSDLKDKITALDASLAQRSQAINADFDRLQRLKNNQDAAIYNAGVPGYNAAVAAYNADVRKEQNLVSQYNAIVEKRNALVIEEGQLLNALDSRQTLQSE